MSNMKINPIENIPPLKDSNKKEENPTKGGPNKGSQSFEDVLKETELAHEQNPQEEDGETIRPELPNVREVPIHEKPKPRPLPKFSDIIQEELGDDKNK